MRECRIVISYKGRVKLDAPIEQWALWARNVEKDKRQTGHVVFHATHTSIAVIEGVHPRKQKLPRAAQNMSRVRAGSWGPSVDAKSR